MEPTTANACRYIVASHLAPQALCTQRRHSNFINSSFLPRPVLLLLRFTVTLPTPGPLLPLLVPPPEQLGILLGIRNHLASSSPRRWLCESKKNARSSFRSGFHLIHSLSSHSSRSRALSRSASSSSLTDQLFSASFLLFDYSFFLSLLLSLSVSHSLQPALLFRNIFLRVIQTFPAPEHALPEQRTISHKKPLLTSSVPCVMFDLPSCTVKVLLSLCALRIRSSTKRQIPLWSNVLHLTHLLRVLKTFSLQACHEPSHSSSPSCSHWRAIPKMLLHSFEDFTQSPSPVFQCRPTGAPTAAPFLQWFSCFSTSLVFCQIPSLPGTSHQAPPILPPSFLFLP